MIFQGRTYKDAQATSRPWIDACWNVTNFISDVNGSTSHVNRMEKETF